MAEMTPFVREFLDGYEKLRTEKLATLVEAEGHSTELSFLMANAVDSVCPGICMTPGCDYTVDVESDQVEGWCEACDENTVTSGLCLAGLI